MDLQTTSLVLPKGNHLALIEFDGGQPVLLAAPRWLISALDVSPDFPIELDGRLAFLGHLARQIRAMALPLEDFLLPVTAANGDLMSLLVQGVYLDNHPTSGRPTVALDIHDVTESVKTRRKAAAVGSFHGLIGQSLRMLEVYHKIATYGPTEAPVLITGETGTGKELVARAMHDRSKRKDKPFVAVNCSALTSELFESELFGHEKGSFTGAVRQHRGRFERADGGTLFLDQFFRTC